MIGSFYCDNCGAQVPASSEEHICLPLALRRIERLEREKAILMKISKITQEELDRAIASLVCVRRHD